MSTLSESARATRATESRFRIAALNSSARAARVIALDARSADALETARKRSWNGARFLRYSGARGAGAGLTGLATDAVLTDLEGHTASLTAEVSGADFVVMVAGSGKVNSAAALIGNACTILHKTAIGLVLKTAGEPTSLLRALRPHVTMLVVSRGDDYLADMLTALRA